MSGEEGGISRMEREERGSMNNPSENHDRIKTLEAKNIRGQGSLAQ